MDTDKLAEKKASLAMTLKNLDKQYGKGMVRQLGASPDDMNVKAISTGILPLDIALGVGGIPRGRIIEIYGPEAGGKTTVALHMIAEVQKQGGIAAFIDVEHALDPIYARRLGVDVNELLISQPDYGEQALQIADELISSAALDIVVIDSVAALVPKAEIEGDMGDAQVGLQARMMSKAMRKLTGVTGKTGTIAVFINQIREKVGIMFGNPETTSGGKALKFHASVRLEVRKAEAIKQGTEVIGHRTKVKVSKNKVAPPFRTAEFDIIYGQGVSKMASILDIGVALEIIEKSGAYFSYQGTRLGQGKENAKKFLNEHVEIATEIDGKIREAVKKPTLMADQQYEIGVPVADTIPENNVDTETENIDEE